MGKGLARKTPSTLPAAYLTQEVCSSLEWHKAPYVGFQVLSRLRVKTDQAKDALITLNPNILAPCQGGETCGYAEEF